MQEQREVEMERGKGVRRLGERASNIESLLDVLYKLISISTKRWRKISR